MVQLPALEIWGRGCGPAQGAVPGCGAQFSRHRLSQNKLAHTNCGCQLGMLHRSLPELATNCPSCMRTAPPESKLHETSLC